MNKQHPGNILIINVHSTMNSGDAALLWLNMRQLRKAFTGSNFTILSNYPKESFFSDDPGLIVKPSPFALINAGSNMPAWMQIFRLAVGFILILIGGVLPLYWLKRMQSNWLALARVYRSSDLVVAVSGAQLVSLGKHSWPLIVSSVPVIVAHLFQKPFYVMPQSIGPLRWKWERRLVRAIYSHARLIFVRDAISMKLMKEIGIPEKKLHFASDPGFALPAASPDQALSIMAQYGYVPGQQAIGVTVIAHLSKSFDKAELDSYYRTLAETLKRFAQINDIKIYIFDQVTGPTMRENDGVAAEAMLKLLAGDQDKIIHVNRLLSPMELKACYSLMDFFVASRLHSGIFSMSAGIPTLFIGYNSKTRGVLEVLGLDKWIVDLKGIDEKQFWDILCLAWENRKEIAEHTLSVINKCQGEFNQVSQLIAEDYLDA